MAKKGVKHGGVELSWKVENDYVKKRSLSGTGVQRDRYITGVSCGLLKVIEQYITSGDWSEKVINFSAKYSSEGRHIGDWAYIRVASRAWG